LESVDRAAGACGRRASHGRLRRLPTWSIGIEISGAPPIGFSGSELARFDSVFKREFPDFETNCALWSGSLAVQLLVRSATPPDALDAALRTIEFAFDEAGINANRVAGITNMTVRPGAALDPRV
jgi:hypothetical protein